METTIIHELIGPVVAKYSLMKAGEIKINKQDKVREKDFSG